MPAEGLPWLPKREILTYEEIFHLARIFIGLGVRTVRLTGGEPLMRQDIDVLIDGLIRLDPGLDLSMTTNGFFLIDKVDRLVQAGLKRINVSVDSLRPDRFERMVRRDGQLVFKIIEGMRRARAAGLAPIKVNCVVMRGYNDDELLEFVRWGRDENFQVRFIEYMPLDAQGEWDMQTVVPGRKPWHIFLRMVCFPVMCLPRWFALPVQVCCLSRRFPRLKITQPIHRTSLTTGYR